MSSYSEINQTQISKKLIFVLAYLFSSFLLMSQNGIVLNNDVYITITNSANLVVDNSNSNAISVTAGGNIISEGEYNVVKWNIGTSTGNYTVPFTTNSLVKIPLEVNITSAGTSTGAIIFSTYETATDVNTSYPSDVTNMNSNCNTDNALYTIDRFWRIDAVDYTIKPTPIINFGYDDAANELAGTNTITETRLKAQRFNSVTGTWETPQKLYGIANSGLNTVSSASVLPVDFYKSWTLIDTVIMSIPITISSVSEDTICSGTTVTITPSGANTYTLETGSLTTNGSFTINPSVTTTYTIEGIDSFGCVGLGVNSATVTINVNAAVIPTITTSSSTLACGASATLTAIGATSYTWNTTETTPNIVVTPSGSTTYTVLSGSGTCTSSATQSIVVNSADTPTITVSSNTVSCGSSATLTAIGAVTYTWSNGATTSSIIVTPTSSTTYTVLTGSGTCTNNATQIITDVNSLQTLTITPDVTIVAGSQTPLTVQGNGTTYLWEPSLALSCVTCTNTTANPLETTNYCVVSSLGTCTTQACVLVTVDVNCDGNKSYDVPNAFSPNGDGVNDEFCLQGWKGCVGKFYVVIYNRWGEKMFESADENFCWDGKNRGQFLDPGVFVYLIQANINNQGLITKKGNITLIK